MITGIELAGLILAVFPLIITGMEHYEESFQSLTDWIKFRVEFNRFFSDLNRQQIFFRQHIEDLLSTVVDSDYHMGCMLDDPDNAQWKDPALETKLKDRLSGIQEYESYMSTVTLILEALEKIKKRLSIDKNKDHWSQRKVKGFARFESEFKRLRYVLDKKRRSRLMGELERYNNNLQQLLGNSDRLEPMRRKRKIALPTHFDHFRKQASSLHGAICEAWQCKCTSIHSTKLLLSRGSDQGFTGESKDSLEWLRLKIYFPLKSRAWSSSHSLIGPEDDWFTGEVGLADIDHTDIPSIRPLSITDSSQQLRLVPTRSDRHSKKVSFHQSSLRRASSSSRVPIDAAEIRDLCAALKEHGQDQSCLGYLRGNDDWCHTIYHTSDNVISPSHVRQIVTLGELFRDTRQESNKNSLNLGFWRGERLEVALIMTKALLQLHSCPWLKDTWNKEDVYLFQDHDGNIHSHAPFLVANLDPNNIAKAPAATSRQQIGTVNFRNAKSCLLSLGILVLELWFNQSIESCSFRKEFLGPNGCENEYTDFNTAQKWQEQAMEEGGTDLHTLTWRCIYCSFGTAKVDLNDEELQNAIYAEVLQPLERLLARYELPS